MPWHRYMGAEDADGEVPEGVQEDGDAEEKREEGKEKVVVVRVQDAPPRAFQIGWEDRKEFGATRGCAGCNSWEVGRGRAPHSKECVARFEALLKGKARSEKEDG